LYNREIRTAVISGRPQFANGVWTRYVGVYDQENDLIKVYPFPVDSPSDVGWLRGLLWQVSSYDTEAVRFSVLEKFRESYNVDIAPVPEFVDADNSIITSKQVAEVMRRVEAQYHERAAMRPDPIKPVIQEFFQATKTLQELSEELLHHEASFKP
jgi:hypothetical protein